MDLKLEDLYPTEVSLDDPELQRKLGQKYEYLELRSGPNEVLDPSRGSLYKYQKMIDRHMRVYDDMLLFWDPGTGKTLAVSAVSEYFKRIHKENTRLDPMNKDYIRKVYIFTKGDSVAREIQKQIICKCSNTEYEEIMKNSRSIKHPNRLKKGAVAKALGDWYVFKHFSQFAREFRKEFWITSPSGAKVPDIDRIRERYSGCLFWIDEGHGLRPETDSDEMEKSPGSGYDSGSESESETDSEPDEETESEESETESEESSVEESTPGVTPEKVKPSDWKRPGSKVMFPPRAEDPREKDYTYECFWYLFHSVVRSKRIISTGTPIVNFPREFGPLMNLLLPVNLQFSQDVDFDKITLNEIAPYINGRVSYVRSADSGVDIRYMGEMIEFEHGEKLHTTLYLSRMSNHQTEGYARAVATSRRFAMGDEGRGVGLGRHTAFYITQKQSSDFVYPDGSYGTAGFSKYVTGKSMSTYASTPVFTEYLRTPGKIYESSCKFGEICERLTSEDYQRGFNFGYLNYHQEAFVLGQCLEAIGFERYSGDISIFEDFGSQDKAGYCGSTGNTKRVVRDIYRPTGPGGKRRRYAIIYGSGQSLERYRNIKEVASSVENIHGDYIEYLISTPIGREGISLDHTLYIDIVDSEWNRANVYQAESRGLRATSHLALIQEHQQRLKAESIDPRSPNAPRLQVKIYRHCALPAEIPPFSDDSYSINVLMYRHMEIKDRRNRRLERLIKQACFDCWLNKDRNVRSRDVDGSPECDYTTCIYPCYNPPPDMDKIDYSTYDLEYIDETLHIIAMSISEVFRTRFKIPIKAMYSLVSSMKSVQLKDSRLEKYVNLTLNKMITERYPVIDRFGFTSYIRESNGMIYLTRSYPSGDSEAMYSLSEYNEKLIGDYEVDVGDLITKVVPINTSQLEVVKKETDAKSLIKELSELPLQVRIGILEEAMIRIRDRNPQGNDILVYQVNSHHVYLFMKPYWLIERYQKASQKKRKGDLKMNKLKEPELISLGEEIRQRSVNVSQSDMVALHPLYCFSSGEDKGTKYSLMKDLFNPNGRYRILEEGGSWRDVSGHIEEKAYNDMIQYYVYLKLLPYSINNVVAFTYRETLESVLVESMYVMSLVKKDDTRQIYRGKNILYWVKSTLYTLLTDLGIPLSKLDGSDIRVIRKWIENEYSGSSEWSEDYARRVYTWMMMDLKNKEYASIILDFVSKEKKMYRIPL